MKIRMLSTTPGSVDGIRVATYEAGVEYDLTGSIGERDLASAFLGADMAEAVGAGDAPSNADADPAGDADEAAPAPKPGRKPKAQ
jgi:hypothetical protein